MEGKSESHCPRNFRWSIRLNRWWTDPLRRLHVYLANHTLKLRNRQGLPTERVGPLYGGKKTLKKSLLKPQNKSPLVNDCFPLQEHLNEESDVDIQDQRADLEKQCTSTSVFLRLSNPPCAKKCQDIHGVDNFPTVEDTGLKACRFGNEAQLHQYETSRGLATTGKRSDKYGRASLEEKLLKLHVPENNVRGTKRLGEARREQNIPKLKRIPVPTLAIHKTNREGQFENNDFPTLPVTVYKRSDKFGRGSLENIERTKITDHHTSAEDRVPYGEKTRTPILPVFKRSDRHGWASLEEKAHRCLNSPEDNLKGGTVRHHRASIEGKGQVKKPLSPAFRIFKRSNRHGGANVEKTAHRSHELRLPENNVHGTSRCWRACPEKQITMQGKQRELTSTVFKRSDKNGLASIEEKVNQLQKSSVSVERADKQVIELVKPSRFATTLGKTCLQTIISHSGNECTVKKMPQLVKLRAPTAVFSLSNRCGRARLEEHGPEFVKPDIRCAQRTNRFRQCTELKPNKSDGRSMCCTSQQQCVHTAKQEECASTTEHDNDASHRLKTSKKPRRLWKRKRNQIIPMLIPATKRGNRVDTYSSLTATSKSFITECKRKGHLNEVARNNRGKTCRYPRADTATISAEPVVNSHGEHNALDSSPEAPKAPNEAKGDKRLLPRTKFTRRRPLQSISRNGSDLAVHCLNQIHQQSDAPYPSIAEPGKMVKIPLSITKGTRQLSCRVYKPVDFEQVIAHDGERVQLGEGSFGNVALVTMRSTDRPLVAVKSFHGSRVRERDVFREVEAMQEAQDHWAFPKLHGVIKNRQALCIALEFIGDSTALMGQTLQHAIRHKKKMKVKHNWISIANDIAHGLNHLHGKGFLHCDLKSNNALLWKDGGMWRAKIIDLGKACRIENARGPMTRLTEAEQQDNFARFPHLPHEVIVGQGGYTVEGDIYSLGYVFRQISTVCSHNNHRMIELATRCYDVEPSCRPTLPRVIQELTSWCLNGHHWWVT